MAYKVPHVVTVAQTLTSGNYLPLSHTLYINDTSTEAHVQTYITHAGTWSGFSLYFRSANASGDSTFTVRVNGVDTAITITVPQSTTGFFQDLTNSVHVDPGDLVSIGFTTTGGTATSAPSITTLFESDSGDSIQYNMALDPDGYSSSLNPRFFRVSGNLNGSPTVEADNQALMQHDGSIEAIGAYVSSNSRTTTTTFTARVNGSDGANTFAVATTATGLFMDTSHSDAFVATDLINGTYTWASGSGTIIIRNFQYTLVSANPRELTFIGGTTLARNASTGTTWNFFVGAFIGSGANEAVCRWYPITPGVFSGYAVYASANTATQTLTYQLRKNSTNVNEVVAIATGVTGWVQDVTNTDTFDLDDYTTLNGSRSVAGSGTTTVTSTTAMYTMEEIVSAFRPIVMMF